MALKRILLCPPRLALVPIFQAPSARVPHVHSGVGFPTLWYRVWQSSISNSITAVLLHPVPSFCVHLHHGILGGRRLG